MDPPGGRPRARRQGPDDPDAGPRGREAEQDRPLRAEAARRARPRADARSRSPATSTSRSTRSTRSAAPRSRRSRSRSRSATRRSRSSATSSPTSRCRCPTRRRRSTLRKETLEKILGQLSQRERRVLELRYGLNGEHPRTLDEVGRAFNVTRERIRQIENQSLKKLRALADSAEAPRRRVGSNPQGRASACSHALRWRRCRLGDRLKAVPAAVGLGVARFTDVPLDPAWLAELSELAPHPQRQRRSGASGRRPGRRRVGLRVRARGRAASASSSITAGGRSPLGELRASADADAAPTVLVLRALRRPAAGRRSSCGRARRSSRRSATSGSTPEASPTTRASCTCS